MNGQNEEKNQLEYDVEKRARAGTKATLRAVVALYVVFMGSRLIRSAYLLEESTMPVGARWGFGIGMIVAALAFGVYIWKQWRSDVEAARIPKETRKDEKQP